MCNCHSFWGKVFYMRHRLQELESNQKCTWLLFLDSDAFVREFDAPLATFIEELANEYRIKRNVAVIVAEDRALIPPFHLDFYPLQRFNTEVPWLNPGVLLVRA